MSVNILDLLKDQVTGTLAKNASSFLGESESNVTNALGSSFPALLGSVIDTVGKGESGANSIMKMIGGVDGNILNNIGGIFSGGASSVNGLLNSGGGIIDSLLGNKMGGLVDFITKSSGLKSGSTSSLLKMAAPFLMGMIGKQVGNSGVSGLTDLIMGQKKFVSNAMPSGLGSILGFATNLFNDGKEMVGNTASATYDAGKKVVGATADVAGDVAKGTVKTGKSVLRWLLPLLLILMLLSWFGFRTGCNAVDNTVDTAKDATENVVGGAADMAKSASDAVGDAAAGALNWTSDALKSVFSVVDETAKAALDKITFAAGSAGDSMMNFIKGGFEGNPVFRFNNLNFKTGSAEIEDAAEVDNIAAILKAYPNVKIEIRGYTDNVGDPAANVTLSSARAMAVKARLMGDGIADGRIGTKGFGEANPVASNDTEEGKAQNRRIEVVVVK
ncbi:MAG TPA: OmpA family protein [Saprospiraceae bacterium]|nr:OmpA family protein [Saprospiraceae bacterium]